MAKPTHHSALEGMGFKLADKRVSGGDDRVSATTHYYTKTSNTVGKDNSIVRPITHHVIVDEFSNSPGKYSAYYQVTQGGNPYAGGDFDTVRRHKDNIRNGSPDPIKDIMAHHKGVLGSLRRETAPPLENITEKNLHRLSPGTHHLTPGWDASDPQMKKMRYIRPGPEYPMVHLNAVQDQPLDPHVHDTLTKSFDYLGRISPGDEDTDVYHASYEDPQDPYMRYGFTVRHMPNATSEPVKDYRGKKDPLLPKPLVFSYDMTHYPIDMGNEDGDYPVGKFLPVSSEGTPVANFTRLGPLVERHHNMLRSIGLMDLPPRRKRPAWHFTAAADEFDDIIKGNGSAGPCWSCGKATYERPEGRSLQSDSSVPINASEETGGDMHGPDINLCGDCATDDMNHHMAIIHGSRGPNRLWHWNDQGVSGCPECESHLMDQADEDLRP
jgi:hypothetical protein